MVAAPAAAQPLFAERLGQWLGWNGAIALTSALAGPSHPAPPSASRRHDVAALRTARHASDAAAEFVRVRAALMALIDAGLTDGDLSLGDFGPFRRHTLACQQAMHDDIAALRQRLRGALAQRGPAGARLAAIDAALEAALAGQERSLLGLVPLRLQAHFEQLQRLQTATGTPGEGADEADTTDEATRLAGFRTEQARLLQAELAHRLLPARGLLDALRNLPSR